ncbi:MAG: tetratricopeptide repeat protein [Candidatus Omnitrophota bacterium]
MRFKNTAGKRILLVFLSFILVLILLELSLQITSGIYAKKFKVDNYARLSDDSCRVLCLGDSFTYGLGADFSKSYPVQLEKILNENSKAKGEFKVFNHGVCSYNSSEILLKLKESINAVNPRIAIVMAGKNDVWNFRQVSKNGTSLEVKWLSLISKLKTYRLAAILTHNIKNSFIKSNKSFSFGKKHETGAALPEKQNSEKNIAQGNKFRAKNLYQKAHELYNYVLAAEPENITALLEKGRCYKLQGRHDEAIDMLLRAFYLKPLATNILNEIEDVFIKQADYGKAIEFYERILEQFPDHVLLRAKLCKSYVWIAGSFMQKKQYEQAKRFYWKACTVDTDDSNAFNGYHLAKYKVKMQRLNQNYFLRNLMKAWDRITGFSLYSELIYNKQRIDRILLDNLNEMARICKNRRVTLIFSGYPQELSEKLKEAAVANEVFLVDHRPIFKDLLRRYPYDMFFVDRNDPHCRAQGYQVMAEDIADVILFLPDS